MRSEEDYRLATLLFAANPLSRDEKQAIRARDEMLNRLLRKALGNQYSNPNETDSADAVINWFGQLGMGGVRTH